MDKNAIKKYAVWAREELIEKVTAKAVENEIIDGRDLVENIDSINGVVLSDVRKKQRAALIKKIKQDGYSQVIEEVSYTWFNRFVAIRFMEVNGYLPTHVRVFSDENGLFRPQILSEAIHLELDGLDKDKVMKYKEESNDDELFKYLLTIQCNALNEILPNMFSKIEDYTELLLPDYLLREGSVIEQLVNLIPEEDWTDQVQILGWLYQYYNTEPKSIVFGKPKKEKVKKEEIPAATQLFTPDWIVRYLVENSLGKMWVESHHNEQLVEKWKYYIKSNEDTNSNTNATLKPEELKCIDPCMGSGHILCYLFDVLIDIYESYGIPAREAASSIVEHNLYGVDIDDRASQFAYFAVMMKARQYDRRFFSRKVQPNIYSVRESDNLDQSVVNYFCNDNSEIKNDLMSLIGEFKNAKEYGSVLRVTNHKWAMLDKRLEEINSEISLFRENVFNELYPLICVAKILSGKYHVVCTNPPYMGNYTEKMSDYILPEYEDSKYDLYSVMVEASLKKLLPDGKLAFVTGDSWMFTDSFLNYRKKIITNQHIDNLAHLGSKAFEAGFGTVAFTLGKKTTGKNSVFIDLTNNDGTEESAYELFTQKQNRYALNQDLFLSISDARYAYKLPEPCFELFRGDTIEKIAVSKAGVVSGDDKYFIKYWCEVDYKDIDFHKPLSEEYSKYHLLKNGGGNNRFYGNNYYVIRLNDLYNPKHYNKSIRRGDKDFYFKKCITWSKVGNQYRRFTTCIDSVCGTASPAIYLKNDEYYNYVLGFLNSVVARTIIDAFNPTMNLQATDVSSLPLVIDIDRKEEIDKLVQENIDIAKEDWDDEETSWGYVGNPLVCPSSSLKSSYEAWSDRKNEQRNRFSRNMERINELFIEIYGLSGVVSNRIEANEITLSERNEKNDMINLLSYIVGCIFGRYSLDEEGIVFAGGDFEPERYVTYQPDRDGIIPVCDDEYFTDDILGEFEKVLKCMFSQESFEDNIKFIAEAIGGKGSHREIIRNYFNNNFYKDHCAKYSFGSSGKRPIYWLFDSGKKGGFKCLVYIYRYQVDTIARIRTDYVHALQSKYWMAIEEINHRMQNVSSSEKIKLNKKLQTLKEKSDEIHEYEEKVHHLADKMIGLDLDDGVKYNYGLIQDILATIK